MSKRAADAMRILITNFAGCRALYTKITYRAGSIVIVPGTNICHAATQNSGHSENSNLYISTNHEFKLAVYSSTTLCQVSYHIFSSCFSKVTIGYNPNSGAPLLAQAARRARFGPGERRAGL